MEFQNYGKVISESSSDDNETIVDEYYSFDETDVLDPDYNNRNLATSYCPNPWTCWSDHRERNFDDYIEDSPQTNMKDVGPKQSLIATNVCDSNTDINNQILEGLTNRLPIPGYFCPPKKNSHPTSSKLKSTIPFLLYKQDNIRRSVKVRNTSEQNMSRQLSSMWRMEPAEVRKYYEQLAESEYANYSNTEDPYRQHNNQHQYMQNKDISPHKAVQQNHSYPLVRSSNGKRLLDALEDEHKEIESFPGKKKCHFQPKLSPSTLTFLRVKSIAESNAENHSATVENQRPYTNENAESLFSLLQNFDNPYEAH